MKNKRIYLFSTLFCCFALFPMGAALGEQPNPQELVRDFYAWYLEEMKDPRSLPISNDAIYAYVYPCTVNKCRIDQKQGMLGSDYFLRTNDFEYAYFKKILVAHSPLNISDSISLVPVGGDKPHIIVFVQKTAGTWRIIKIEDILQRY